MKLRDDLLMCYRGVSNWPPAWVGKDVQQSQQLGGEIGILKNVIQSKIKPLNRLYLTIEHEGEEYLGALLFDDQFACQRTYKLLLRHRGEPIHKIGEIEIPQSAPMALEERGAKYAVRHKIVISQCWMMCGEQRFQSDTETKGYVLNVLRCSLLKNK
jgi:hypothetical protein